MVGRTPAPRRMVRQPLRHSWHLLLSAGLVLVSVAALLYGQWEARPQPPPPPAAPRPVATATSPRELADTLFAAVVPTAAKLGIPAQLIERRRGSGAPDLIQIRVPAGLALAEAHLEMVRLAESRGGDMLRGVEPEPGKRVEVTCGFRGTPTTVFTFVRDATAQRPSGDIAIVVDDTDGPTWNTARMERFCAVPQPLTFALLPSREQFPEMARIARDHGHEVMAYLPVEPDIEGREAGKSALRGGSSDDEVRERVLAGLRRVPTILGVSAYIDADQHDGARLMGLVVAELQPRGLLYLGDRRPVGSEVDNLARQLGSRALIRDLRLDSQDDPAYVEARIGDLARIAVTTGRAIGTGRPTESVLNALEATLPGLEKRGMRFVTLAAASR